MGVFEKFLNLMKLNDDEYDDEYYDDGFDDDYEEDRPARRPLFGGRRDEEDDFDEFEPAPTLSNKVTPMRQPAPRKNSAFGMEVCVIKPNNVNDQKEIGETLLAGRTVILNLEGLDLEIAQRIIDFISGTTFAINGNLQRISNYIFLVTPDNVDISGDLQDLLSGSVEAPPLKGRY